MPHDVHDPDVLDASTVLSLCCLALLALSYVAMGYGVLQMAAVALPAAFRGYMAGF